MRSGMVMAALALAATTAVAAELPAVGQRAPALTLPAAVDALPTRATLDGDGKSASRVWPLARVLRPGKLTPAWSR